MGKFFVFGAAIQMNDPRTLALAVVGVVMSVVAAFYYLKMVKAAYSPEDEGEAVPDGMVAIIEQLLAKPVHKIGPFGSVESLTLQVKRTPLDDYRLQRRGGQGIITIRTTERNGPVLGVAQVIDDGAGRTLAQASTAGKEVRGKISGGGNIAAATAVGETIAERLKSSGIECVVFDRGGYLYHGRVKALADAAREAGLKF